MFNTPRALRQCSTLSTFAFKRSLQSQIRHQSRLLQGVSPERIQRVQFRSPGLTPRRAITFALYTTCLVGYVYWVFPDVELEEVEVEETEDGKLIPVGAEEDGDEWAHEDSRFIPLTWAKQLPKTFYKGSDPEWQEFRRIAKDKQGQQKVYAELISVMMSGVATHPQISRSLGKDIKVGKYWLDTQFPDGPPREYARKGIEIGDGFIAWSEQRISAEQQNRTSRTLWPTATANSLYAFYKTLFGFQYRKVKEMLGIDNKAAPGSQEARLNNMIQILEEQQAQRERGARGLGKPQTDPGPDSGAVGTTATNQGLQSTAPQKPGKAPSSSETAGGPDDKWYMPSVKPGIPGQDMEQVVAGAVFAQTLHKSQTQEKQEPPRGTFIVTGLVQMRGSRAAMTFDVQGFYDPKGSRFATINVSPRSIKLWKQSPRGGP